MKKKLLLPAIAVLLLTPWPVAYAYDDGLGGQDFCRVEAAENGDTVAWETYGGAIGGVEQPVDLFYVDVAESPADVAASLYLTNTTELIHGYRYLILKVGIYTQDDNGDWQACNEVPDNYITMQNGRVDFTLTGYGNYKITIDSGSFNRYPATGGGASPEFYLSAQQR